MIKVNSNIGIEKEIDSAMWFEIKFSEKENELQDYDYKEFRILGVHVFERNAKEYKRDFSFVVTKRYSMFVEHIETKEVYGIDYDYNATFKSDGYKLRRVYKIDKESVEDKARRSKESAVLNIDEFNSDYMFNLYILATYEDENYKYSKYSYHLNWHEVEEEEDDEE